jgi:hypothetical protein
MNLQILIESIQKEAPEIRLELVSGSEILINKAVLNFRGEFVTTKKWKFRLSNINILLKDLQRAELLPVDDGTLKTIVRTHRRIHSESDRSN